MNICNRTNKKFVAGRLYKGESGTIYIATGEGDEKVSLEFGYKDNSSFLGGNFTDVTDSYCLQKVK